VTQIELIAKTFCEASGLYKWEDTRGSLRQWYLTGAAAVLTLGVDDIICGCCHGKRTYWNGLLNEWRPCPDCCH
jgi:hypothetical protein